MVQANRELYIFNIEFKPIYSMYFNQTQNDHVCKNTMIYNIR